MTTYYPGPNEGLVWHRRGIAWYMRRPPWRWHLCRVHTQALLRSGGCSDVIERCACGSYRLTPFWEWTQGKSASWRDRNSRRGQGAEFLSLI
jgi:hypothetical protein